MRPKISTLENADARRMVSVAEKHARRIKREDARMPKPIRDVVSSPRTLLETIFAGMGEGGRFVTGILTCMEIAGREIEEAKKALEGDAKQRAHDAFHLLMPGDLAGYSPAVYRDHCREMIARSVAREDVRPGTRAEVLTLLSRLSLKAPLARDHFALAMRLSREVFGKDFEEGQPERESRAGAVDELFSELRHHTRKEDRGKS